jgi:UDP:flavonoid glycosyltransferase YjiC (YdhE family)
VRVLLSCSVGGSGHLDPLRPVIESLRGSGDEVLLVVPPSLETKASSCGCEVHVGAEPPAAETAEIRDAIAAGPRSVAAVLSERELFGRLSTAAMLPAMNEAFASFRPELVLREPCEYASCVLAARTRVAQAQVAISQGTIELAALRTAAQVLEAYENGVVAKITRAPYLTRFPERLDPSAYPDTRRYSIPRPVAAKRPASSRPGDERPFVYMSFGSLTGAMAMAPAIYAMAVQAAAAIPTSVLLSVGNRLEITSLGALPDNLQVEAWVPQEDVFAKASLVISHGGSGTTFGALAAGIPQVVVPLFADQFQNARRIVEAGTGLSVSGPEGPDGRCALGPSDAARIAMAARRVLGEPSYREAAATIAEEMALLPSLSDVLAGIKSPC